MELILRNVLVATSVPRGDKRIGKPYSWKTSLALQMVVMSCSLLGYGTLGQAGTSFQFVQFSQNRSSLALLGDASVAQNDLALELTRNSSGRALYRDAVRFKDPATQASISFTTSFIFSIETGAEAANIGEGLAFLIAPDNTTIGNGGPWMGLLSPVPGTSLAAPISGAKLVAVEFDVQQDVEFWDINNNHVGVDINSLNSVFAREAASGSQEVNLQAGHTKVWIEYNGGGRKMQVSLTPYTVNNSDYVKPDVPLLALDLDLSGIVNEYMFVGFSAATRSGTVQHKVWAWKFESSMSATQGGSGVGYGTLAPMNLPPSQPAHGTAASRSLEPRAFALLSFACLAASVLQTLA